jgi:hypothetical protein
MGHPLKRRGKERKPFYVIEKVNDGFSMERSARIPVWFLHPSLGNIPAVRLDSGLYRVHPSEDLEKEMSAEGVQFSTSSVSEGAKAMTLYGFAYDLSEDRLPFVKLWDGYLGTYNWS